MRRTTRRGAALGLALGLWSCDLGTEPGIESDWLPSDLVNNMERRYMSSVLADLDGDGDLDLALGGMDGDLPWDDFPRDALLWNDGTGRFVFAPESTLPPRHGGGTWGTVDIEAGDVDGDGDIDLVMSEIGPRYNGDAALQLFLNDGSGGFTDGTAGLHAELENLYGSGSFVTWLSLADVDGDGDSDLLVSGNGYANQVYENLGGGEFQRSAIFDEEFDTGSYHALVPGDVNGDGNQDVLLISDVSEIGVMLGDGGSPTAYEARRTLIQPGLQFPDGALVEAGDGGAPFVFLAQLIFPPEQTAARMVRWDDASDGFVEVSEAVFPGGPYMLWHPRHYAVADFDGDGLEDVFVADHGPDVDPFPGARNRIFMQKPDGTFVEESAVRLPDVVDFSHNVAAGDVDGDGDVDLFVANLDHENGPYLLVNDGGMLRIQR